MKDIIISGAGIAGLTLAYLIKSEFPEATVSVVEKEPQIGGLAKSFNVNGFIFDIGPHRFFSKNNETNRLINKILKGNSLNIKRKSSVWLYGKYHDWPLNYKSVFKLPPSIMVRAFLDVFKRKKNNSPDFKSYVVSKYGNTLYEEFFAPYTEKFLSSRPEELHKDWAATSVDRAVIANENQLKNIFDVVKSVIVPPPAELDFTYPEKGGIGYFCEKLYVILKEKGVKFYLNSEIKDVEVNDKSVVALKINGKNLKCGNLIWSAPPNDFLKLIDEPLADIEFLSSVCFFIGVKGKNKKTDFQWCYYGTPDILFNRVSFPANFSKYNAKEGFYTVCVEISLTKKHLNLYENTDLLPVILQDLKKTNVLSNISSIEFVEKKVISNTYPVYKLNFKEEMAEFLKFQNKIKNLYFLGRCGKFWYNNMDHSIEDAMSLLPRIARDVEEQ